MKERTRHVCVCIASAFFRASPVLDCLVFQNRQRGNPARQGAMSKWWNPDQLLNTTVEFEQSTSSAERGGDSHRSPQGEGRYTASTCVLVSDLQRARDRIKEGIMSVIYMKVGGVVVSASNCETLAQVRQLSSCRSHRDNNFHT